MMSEEPVEGVIEPSYIIFISRKKINGKNLIVDYVEYYPVTNHFDFIKLRINQDQFDLIQNWGSDEIDLALLISDFSEPDQVSFLSDDKNDETRDVRQYGIGLSKYLIINEPVEEAQND